MSQSNAIWIRFILFTTVRIHRPNMNIKNKGGKNNKKKGLLKSKITTKQHSFNFTVGQIYCKYQIHSPVLYVCSAKRQEFVQEKKAARKTVLHYFFVTKSSSTLFNTLRTGSFKLFKRPFPEFLTILTL